MAGYSDTYEDAYAFYADTFSYLSFDPVLSRVLVDLAEVRSILGADDTGTVQRSVDGIVWTTVRGGSGVAVTSAAQPLSDYEFAPDVDNLYRVLPSTGSILADITPDLGGTPWLKNLRFPFLNTPITFSDVSDIIRAAGPGADPWRSTGDSLFRAPVVMRGGRTFTLTVPSSSDDQTAALDLLAASGDCVLVQTPAGYPVPLTGYYAAGDLAETRNGVSWPLRWITLPLTEVIAPADTVAPITGIWSSVTADYPTWADVAAGLATWADVVSLVGAPGDIVVS